MTRLEADAAVVVVVDAGRADEVGLEPAADAMVVLVRLLVVLVRHLVRSGVGAVGGIGGVRVMFGVVLDLLGLSVGHCGSGGLGEVDGCGVGGKWGEA